MSDSNYELSVEFTGQDAGLAAAAAAASATISALQQKIDAMSASMASASAKFATSMAAMAASTAAATDKIDTDVAGIKADLVDLTDDVYQVKLGLDSDVAARLAEVEAEVRNVPPIEIPVTADPISFALSLAALRTLTATIPPISIPVTAHANVVGSAVAGAVASSAASAGGRTGLLGALTGGLLGAGSSLMGRHGGLVTNTLAPSSGLLGVALFGGGLHTVLGGFGGIGVGGLGALAGLGPEHVMMTAAGIAGSAGLGTIGALGAAAPMGVGMGADAAVMSSTIADTQTLATSYGSIQTAQQGVASAQAVMNAAIATYGPKSAQATAATTAYQSALSGVTSAQVSMDQTVATLSGTTPALTNALTQVQLAQLNVNAAVSAYGAGSSQAAAATAQLTAAQNNFNTALTKTAPGVAAELKLGQAVSALNVQWDQMSQQARVAAVNIAMAFIPIGAEYIPMVANAAQRNFALVGQYLQPIISTLRGPAAAAFNNLEDIFASHIPAGMSIANSALQIFINFIKTAANVVNTDFGNSLEKAAQYLKQFADGGSKVGEVANFAKQAGNAFYDWVQFLKQIAVLLGHLFADVPGTGTAIITTLTNDLKDLNSYLSSMAGKNALQRLLDVHKTEVLTILQLLPPVLSDVGQALLTVEPPLITIVTDMVKLTLALYNFLTNLNPAVKAVVNWGIGLTLTLAIVRLLGPTLRLAGIGLDVMANGMEAVSIQGQLLVFMNLYSVFVRATEGIRLAAGSMLGLDAAMDANVFALIVIGIAALIVIIVLLITHWNEVKAVTASVWSAITSAFTSGVNTVISSLDFLIAKWDAVAKVLGLPIIPKIAPIPTGPAPAPGAAPPSLAGPTLAKGAAAGSGAGAAASPGSPLYTAVGQQPTPPAGPAASPGSPGYTSAALQAVTPNLAPSSSPSLLSQVETQFAPVTDFYKNEYQLLGKITEVGLAVLFGLWVSAGVAIWQNISGTWSLVEQISKTAWSWIEQAAHNTWFQIQEDVLLPIQNLVGLLGNLWNGEIWPFLKGVWQLIQSTAKTDFGQTAANALAPMTGLVQDFRTVWGELAAGATAGWAAIGQAVGAGVALIETKMNSWIGTTNSVLKALGVGIKIPTFQIAASLSGTGAGGGGGGIGVHAMAGGGVTNGPTAIVGEGPSAHPEFVIPTDPAYRSRALSLYAMAGTKLMAGGGIVSTLGRSSWEVVISS